MNSQTPELNLYRKSYDILVFTGTVVGSDKHLETKISSTGGGGTTVGGFGTTNRVRVTSKTITHDDIFLQNEQGEEKAFKFKNFNISCREGHELTVISVIQKGKERGPHLAVVNHTTNEGFSNLRAAKSELRIFNLETFLFPLAVGLGSYFIVGTTEGMAMWYGFIAGFVGWVVNEITGFINARKFYNHEFVAKIIDLKK